MRTLILLLAASQLAAQTPVSASALFEQKNPVKNLVTAELVKNNVDFLFFAIAQRANLEAAFCVVGSIDKSPSDTVRIDMLVPAWIDAASSGNAVYQPEHCDMPNTIGTLHFHPGFGFCRLSPDDIVSAKDLSWPLTAIVCTEKPGDKPKIVAVRRDVFEEEWRALEMADRDKPPTKPHIFTPVYRYRRP